MRKSNIRSIRFNDEIKDIIDQQVGENFSEKFERLIYNCYMLSPQLEKELDRLNEEIARKNKELRELYSKTGNLITKHKELEFRLGQYQSAVEAAIGSTEAL